MLLEVIATRVEEGSELPESLVAHWKAVVWQRLANQTNPKASLARLFTSNNQARQR